MWNVTSYLKQAAKPVYTLKIVQNKWWAWSNSTASLGNKQSAGLCFVCSLQYLLLWGLEFPLPSHALFTPATATHIRIFRRFSGRRTCSQRTASTLTTDQWHKSWRQIRNTVSTHRAGTAPSSLSASVLAKITSLSVIRNIRLDVLCRKRNFLVLTSREKQKLTTTVLVIRW